MGSRLKPKHLKALELLANNDMNFSEVAKQCGISRDHLGDLINGDPKAGPISEEFAGRYKKIVDEITKRTEVKAKALREIIIQKLTDWVKILPSMQNASISDRRTMVDIINALSKNTSMYHIDQVTYSRGLTGEDLINEFRRLTALAGAALDGGAVSSLIQRDAGLLSAPLGGGSEAEEDQETPPVYPESEAGTLS